MSPKKKSRYDWVDLRFPETEPAGVFIMTKLVTQKEQKALALNRLFLSELTFIVVSNQDKKLKDTHSFFLWGEGVCVCVRVRA